MNDTYDIIIFGMGPAGEVAAHRLVRGGTLADLRDSMAQFPTYIDAYLKVVEQLHP